jgi:hypothetical protein
VQGASMDALGAFDGRAILSSTAGPTLLHELTHKRLSIQPYRGLWQEADRPPSTTGRWFDWPLPTDAPVPRPLQIWAQGDDQ